MGARPGFRSTEAFRSALPLPLGILFRPACRLDRRCIIISVRGTPSAERPVMRYRPILLAVLLVAGLCLSAQAPAGEIKIAWYGQSMFEIITPKGTRIVLDPHNIEAYRVRPLKADLVLMSHLHTDHTRLDVIANAKEAKQYNAL